MQSVRRLFFPLLAACGPFEHAPTLAVAVSGGADSMALLLLAHDWANAEGGSAVALTVDHGLRKESAEEAKQVQQWCEAWGIEQHILRIQDSGFRIPDSGIQAAARDARYRLLTDWCKMHHVLHLLTAHHQDDQAETLFFRLGRGSGLDGLACMPAVSQVHGVRLLRPLLGMLKSRLKALLMEAGQPWIEDPSNQSPRYTRNRIRAHIAESENPATLSERAGALAQRFGEIRNRNEHRLAVTLPEIISIFPDHAYINLTAFLTLPPDDGMRLLAALTMTLGGRATPPRAEKLQRLHKDFLAFNHRRSFGALMFIRQARYDRLLVRRLEKPAGSPHIHTVRRPAKALAATPFSAMNDVRAAEEGARTGYA
ncbi:MAG: tRNA lysidine(34) synthetase TilS [Pseudomonadota bacterium]|nr:tRNA lysidine(34) synthetase TilS [Pseudomonadota bacterium]MDE3037497.1 tRNA lysidine(34) synthetase TilS [Pseudomonadota bacterium]